MAIQIRGNQIQNATVGAAKINLTDTFDFSSGVVQVATPSNASDAATKGYVDSLVADGFQAGNGISIDTGTSPDTISVKVAADGALQFTGAGTDELGLKLSGSTLSKDSFGLKVADGGISDAQINASAAIAQSKLDLAITDSEVAAGANIAVSKLAASTISGVTLGSNLNSLQPASGAAITMSSYDGSSAVSDLDVKYDNSTIGKNISSQLYLIDGSVSSQKIATGAVGTTQLAGGAVSQAKLQNNSVGSAQIIDGSVGSAELAGTSVTAAKLASDAVVTDKIQNAAVTAAKLSFEAAVDWFTPSGSQSAFALAQEVPPDMFGMVLAFKNGLLMRGVAGTPADADEYSVSTTTGTTSVTFGANLSASDTLQVRSFGIKAP